MSEKMLETGIRATIEVCEPGKKLKTVRPATEECKAITHAAWLIAEGNKAMAKAKKEIEAGKETLARWLKNERGIDINSLPIGSMVNIEGICLVEVGSQTRFDQKRFAVINPITFAKFNCVNATLKFKPLV